MSEVDVAIIGVVQFVPSFSSGVFPRSTWSVLLRANLFLDMLTALGVVRPVGSFSATLRGAYQ